MNTTRSLRRHALLTGTAAVAALVLAACGGADDGSPTSESGSASASASASNSAEQHNDADVAFVQEMIQHHRQAIDMAELAGTRASSAEVSELATAVSEAQGPEIETMTGWLESWGEEVPEATGGMDMEGMDHGDGSDMADMPGMMDDQQMTELENASGAEFDTMFLTMMIEHHRGAIEMAETEQEQGAYGPAVTLAEDVVIAQTDEITRMERMLDEH
jgi:uncharacterized protein (DUF305 family)